MEKKNPFNLVSSKKSRFILPNLLTIIGVCLGISSIKFALDQNYSLAVIFIVFAAILDALDGRIARLIKGTTDFGKELDSLTDFVSFGIAPAFILYFWELKNYGKIGWAITLIFFKEKVGILLIKKTATMTTRYGVNFLISKFNWISESS